VQETVYKDLNIWLTKMQQITIADIPERLHEYIAYRYPLSLDEFLKVVLKPEDIEWHNQFRLHAGSIKKQEDFKKFIIDLESLAKYLGYSRLDVAKRNLKDMEESIDYEVKVQSTSMGGRPKETINLTMNAARRFCIKSKTKIGNEIAKMVVRFMESVEDFLLIDPIYTFRNCIHNKIVEAYSNFPVIYLADVFLYQNGFLTVLKKIGQSHDLSSRQHTLSSDMKTTCTFTHAFRCARNFALEQNILKDPRVKQHLYVDPINGHVSKETVKFNEAFTESDLLQLIKQRVEDFNRPVDNLQISELQTQIDDLKFKLSNAKEVENIQEVKTAVKESPNNLEMKDVIEAFTSQINALEDKFILGYLSNTTEVLNRKNSRGYKIQQINPNNPTVAVAVFESAIHVTRVIQNASKSRILNAIAEHTLYMGYRWARVSDDQDDDRVVKDLPPVKVFKKSTHGLVAKLDKDAKTIKEVFSNQREAMKEAQLASPGSISVAIKNNTLSRGHRYMMYDNCTPEQRAAYEDDHGDFNIIESGGVKTHRLHSRTRIRLETYANIETVVKKFRVSRATLKKAVSNKTLLKNFYWEFDTESA